MNEAIEVEVSEQELRDYIECREELPNYLRDALDQAQGRASIHKTNQTIVITVTPT